MLRADFIKALPTGLFSFMQPVREDRTVFVLQELAVGRVPKGTFYVRQNVTDSIEYYGAKHKASLKGLQIEGPWGYSTW